MSIGRVRCLVGWLDALVFFSDEERGKDRGGRIWVSGHRGVVSEIRYLTSGVFKLSCGWVGWLFVYV